VELGSLTSLGDTVPVASGSAAAGPPVALAETCRVVRDVVPLWRYHRQRLSEGGCSDALLRDVEEALAGAIDAYEGGPTTRLRAHVEVFPDGSSTVELERRLSSLDVVNGPLIAPVSLAELPGACTPLHWAPMAAKPADRSWWDTAARIARERGAHQALIVDGEGFVVDGSSANVWIVCDDVLFTPPAPPAVAGVARRFLLDRSKAVGLEARVRLIRVREIGDAHEVLLTNAFGGVVAVRGRGGAVTEAVRELFDEAWRP
jgi:hypothetical protein